MKTIYLTFGLLTYSVFTIAQTNIFPSDGNVGIGITNPLAKLTVVGGGLATSNAGLSISSYLTSGRLTTGTVNSIHNFLDQESLELSSGSSQKTGISIEGIASSYGSSIRMFTGNSERMRINSFGSVGIGTTNPEQALDVQGNTITRGSLISSVTDPNIGGRLLLNNPAKTTPGSAISWQIFNMSGAYGNSLQFWAYDAVGCSDPSGLCSNRFTLMDNGNVGIGTTVPNSKLAVNGNIRAHEIKVETNNWPDYVFTKEYLLPTLKETENHIKEKGHLPGIPSAEEVKTNGINLGEMNAKLLQKIEELTLYLIEIKKENQQQREDIEYLKSKLK